MLIPVTVTKSHIKRGTRGDRKKCPVALAIKPLINRAHSVAVGILALTITHKKHNSVWRWRFNKAVHNFVENVDLERDVKPFIFNINIPRKFLK